MRVQNGNPGWRSAPRAKRLHLVFALCAAVVSAWAPLGAATLTLSAPVYSSCGVVTINLAGYSPLVRIVQNTWNWGDGSITRGCYVRSRGEVRCGDCGFTPVAELSGAFDWMPGSILAGWKAFVSP